VEVDEGDGGGDVAGNCIGNVAAGDQGDHGQPCDGGCQRKETPSSSAEGIRRRGSAGFVRSSMYRSGFGMRRRLRERALER
jgi:hypothetical protein